MPTILYGSTKPLKKQNRKPGWEAKKAEHDAWLQRVSTMKTAFGKGYKKPAQPKVDKNIEVLQQLKMKFVNDAGTKRVSRPELQYAENEELLVRELKAREVKHNSAPAYNKGGPQFVSEAELVATLSTNKRR